MKKIPAEHRPSPSKGIFSTSTMWSRVTSCGFTCHSKTCQGVLPSTSAIWTWTWPSKSYSSSSSWSRARCAAGKTGWLSDVCPSQSLSLFTETGGLRQPDYSIPRCLPGGGKPFSNCARASSREWARRPKLCGSSTRSTGDASLSTPHKSRSP